MIIGQIEKNNKLCQKQRDASYIIIFINFGGDLQIEQKFRNTLFCYCRFVRNFMIKLIEFREKINHNKQKSDQKQNKDNIGFLGIMLGNRQYRESVSYTHLDVYKRQL